MLGNRVDIVGLPDVRGPPDLKEADPALCWFSPRPYFLGEEETDESSLKPEHGGRQNPLAFLLQWSLLSSGPATCLQTLETDASLVQLRVGDWTAMCLSVEGAALGGPRAPLSLAAACRLAATSWPSTSSLRGARAQAPQIPRGAGSGCLKP